MPTLTLPELQGEIWRALTHSPGNNAATETLLREIEPGPALPAMARLQVYVDAYYWRLHQVLLECFPRLGARLGPKPFQDLVSHYLRAHPSTHASISYVGRALPEFLDGFGLPLHLADLARLEWAQAMVFEAADATPLNPDTLREVPPQDWPDLRFRPIPALTTLHLRYPVHLLWRDEAARVDLPAPTVLRVWRNANLEILHSVMDEREARAFESMLRGDTFTTLCETFADLDDMRAAQESIDLLTRWLQDGILAAS